MLEILRSVLAYVVAIGVLVTFHELGHFWIARLFGIRVLRFSIGFGRSLWSHVARNGCEYRIASIPLGGYVKMLDEREAPVPAEMRGEAFNRQRVGVRAAVLFAGPGFNFLLAIVLYWAALMLGLPDFKTLIGQPAEGSAAERAGLVAHERVTTVDGQPVSTWSQMQAVVLDHALARTPLHLTATGDDGQSFDYALDLSHVRIDPQHLYKDVGLSLYQPPVDPKIGTVQPGSPAEQSGLQSGDVITALDETDVKSFQDIQRYIVRRPGAVVVVHYTRAGQDLSTRVVVATVGEGADATGLLGIGPAPMANMQKMWQDLRAELRLGPVAAAGAAVSYTWRDTLQTLQLFYRMLCGEVSLKNISGPVGSAQMAGDSAGIGFSTFIAFLAFVSLNLGIVNLLPIPILDGGHLLFCGMEAIKGSPLSERAQIIGQQIGFALLALLIGLACFNDFSRFVS